MSRQVILVIIHALLGLLLAQYRQLTGPLGIFIFFVALVHIVYSKNGKDEAAIWSAYFVGLEVVLRMTGGFVFWEMGKYVICIFLALGLLVQESRKSIPVQILLYAALLVPSFSVVEFPDFERFRQAVSFNLSGPLSLIIASWYFFRRALSPSRFVSILRSMVFPLVTMLVYLALVTPDLSEIEYGTQSNFQATAGFGPNQVSTMIGACIFCLVFFLFTKQYVTGSFLFDIVLVFAFSIRGLATFSRGGLIAGVLALLVFFIVFLFRTSGVVQKGKSVVFFAFGSALLVLSWIYVDNLSQGRLTYRYQGINYRTGQQKDITSNRVLILEHEIGLFLSNPVFGIGPGMIREQAVSGLFFSNTHSEYSRTLAEHGVFGLGAILLLITFPLFHFREVPPGALPVLVGLYVLALITMSHSAMRLALPGFYYGLALTFAKRSRT
ncbi:MAG: O-antigen ligase family protein [Cyclobacteriaceae bacterium]|nr:O-antigen ligase family protein [Cyclobacteriaceae bacterium]